MSSFLLWCSYERSNLRALTAYFDGLCYPVFRFQRLSALIRTLKACPQKPKGLRTMKVQCFTAYPSASITGCFEPTGLRHDTLQRPS